MPFDLPKVAVPLWLRVSAFILLPPTYVLLWTTGWLSPYTWSLGPLLAPRLHRVWVRVEWEDALKEITAGALKPGHYTIHQIKSALHPYTPEDTTP